MSISSFRIRTASASDAVLLAEMGAETFSDSFAAQNTPENMAAYLAESFGPVQQALELAEPDSKFLIVEDAGQPAGYARLKFGHAPAEVSAHHPVEIGRFYARKPWIGRGVGPFLMQACLAEAQQAGCDVAWLDVWELNPRAIAFYIKWGFAAVGQQTFKLGADLQHDLLMARSILPDHPEIYNSQAAQYEALVSNEDWQHNILPALQAITPLADVTVAELGAGTGRLTCLLAPVVHFIHAFDNSQHMLDVAIAKLEQSGLHNWRIAVSDHRQLPLPEGAANVAISGWSVCYVVVDNPTTWQEALGRVLAEMERVVCPGGHLIILETLGTGFELPHPPDHLLRYYAYLEGHGFQRSWIRTDYQFASLPEAEDLVRFFFGEAMLEKIVPAGAGALLPECTGIWWRKLN
jgi:ubiquinone/menaquinone biosynthesis C-methylase UbiE/GNAT superfamily N-acetyltransferase